MWLSSLIEITLLPFQSIIIAVGVRGLRPHKGDSPVNPLEMSVYTMAKE
jgi:hypothetical protein